MNASESNVAALAMVIRASLTELRNVATAMARSPKTALPRLIDEAGVLSGALQRLDKALESAPASAGMDAQRTEIGIKAPEEIATDPESAAKWLLALDRARRWAMPEGRCPACGGCR